MNELISRLDLSMMLSVSPDTLDNITRDGHLSRYQPADRQRKLPHFKRSEVDEFCYSIFHPGYPGVPFRPVTLDDPLVSPHEAARAIGAHIGDLLSWRKVKRIPAYKLRHSMRYRVSDIQYWLALCNDEFSKRYIPNKAPTRLQAVRG